MLEYTNQYKWDLRFLKIAKEVSTWSKDPSTKVGAIIVDHNKHILSTGYNGFPKGIEDNERLEERVQKYQIILHAEENALMRIGNFIWSTYEIPYITIYTYPLPPCSRCMSMIIQSGIRRVVSITGWPDRWSENINLAMDLAVEAGINVKLYKPEELI